MVPQRVARKKVVLLASFAESLINFRQDLIREILIRGHEIIAVAPDMDQPTADALKRLGASAMRVAFSRTGMNPLSDLGGILRLRSFLASQKPDVIVSYTAKPVIYGTLAASLTGMHHVGAMITGLGFAFTPGAGLKRKIAKVAASMLYRVALPRASHVVFQNEDDRALFKNLSFLTSEQKVSVVNGSGVNLEQFAQAPLPIEPVFLMIGRFLGAKGIREYATAAAHVRHAFPKARTAVIGWIDQGSDSIAQAELDAWTSQGMENWGRLSDVRPAIAKASVIVLPSYREGTPRSVLEGMAMGRAIITTDAPGCRMTVEDGANGYKVAVGDANQLAEAMLVLARDAQLRDDMGRASRKRVEDFFESRSVAKATADGFGL